MTSQPSLPGDGDTRLYRDSARHSRAVSWLGPILLIRPLPLTVFCALAILFTTAAFVLLFVGTHSPSVHLTGVLFDDPAPIEIYSARTAMVRETNVAEGDRVSRGTVLFKLQPEAADAPAVGSATTSPVAHRALLDRIADLTSRLGALTEVIRLQDRHLESTDNLLSHDRKLRKQGEIAAERLLWTESRMKDSLAQSRMLEQERRALIDKIQRAQTDLEAAAAIFGEQRSEAHPTIDDGFTASDDLDGVTEVTAPADGVVAAIFARDGQSVGNHARLAAISPIGAKTRACLVMPSSAVVWTKSGDRLKIRYEAYPSKEFGEYDATILEILPPTRLHDDANGCNAVDSAHYRAIADLSSTTVEVNGVSLPLHAGMKLEGDVALGKRPLYTLIGKSRESSASSAGRSGGTQSAARP